MPPESPSGRKRWLPLAVVPVVLATGIAVTAAVNSVSLLSEHPAPTVGMPSQQAAGPAPFGEPGRVQAPRDVPGSGRAAERVRRGPVLVVSSRVRGSVTGADAVRRVSTQVTPADLPPEAFDAYQRAAIVMRKASPGCHLDWSMLAAIGKIESDHGRAQGNHFDKHGVATPGIYGVRLAAIGDTDGGVLDGDRTADRAVGPMQFIPGTWRIVAVDSDGDGQRNPQSIADSALAAGVYLCSTHADLSSDQGVLRAAMAYNHSQVYASQVLALTKAYASGASPMLLMASTAWSAVAEASNAPGWSGGSAHALGPVRPAVAGGSHSSGTATPSASASGSPTSAATPGGGTTSPGPVTGGSGGPTPKPTESPTPTEPAPTDSATPSPPVDPTPTVEPTPTEPAPTVASSTEVVPPSSSSSIAAP